MVVVGGNTSCACGEGMDSSCCRHQGGGRGEKMNVA